MDKEDIKLKFIINIREHYERELREWLTQEPEELVSGAEEIAASKMLYETLPAITSKEEMEFLLCFSNPLEMVRDEWLGYDGVDKSDEIRNAVHNLSKNSILLEISENAAKQELPEIEVTMC